MHDGRMACWLASEHEAQHSVVYFHLSSDESYKTFVVHRNDFGRETGLVAVEETDGRTDQLETLCLADAYNHRSSALLTDKQIINPSVQQILNTLTLWSPEAITVPFQII